MFQTENLPKTICDSCYDLLTEFFNFKQTCINSQNTLLECKSNVKTENNELTKCSEIVTDIQVNDDHDDEIEDTIKEEIVDEFKNGTFNQT